MIFLKKSAEISPYLWRQELAQLMESYRSDILIGRYAINDEDVQEAQHLAMISSAHPKDATISIFVNDDFNIEAFVAMCENLADGVVVYEVLETEPLKEIPPLGRVRGMCQIALLKRPAHLTEEQWLTIWQGSHTQIAIDTQSTFSYRQNKVVRVLASGDYPLYDAIVEEQFPSEAMTNRAVFFNAKDDEEKYKANEKAMIDSCMRFVDFSAFECIQMSEYRIK